MNEHLRHPFPPPRKLATTQAADGYPRRAWTADDVQKMMEAGILEHGERLELIGGELVAMASKGILHERVKLALCEYWYDHRPKHLRIAPESALRLGDHDEPEPELFIFPATIEPEDVRGDAVLLVVEIADSSLVPDRTVKALRYARHGVREYWVVNARTRGTTVFTEPTQTGYAVHREIAADQHLIPMLVPELAVRLADLT